MTDLDLLIQRAEWVSEMDTGFRLTQYKIVSPIPPLLASGKENYTMANTVARHRFSKEIAEELLKLEGNSAHFYALMKVDDGGNRELWRDVLSWLDELGGNDGGRMDTTGEGRGEEQSGDTEVDRQDTV